MTIISNKDELRQLYNPAKGRSLKKELSFIDVHCKNFIELSPFLIISSGSLQGLQDSSPRGGKAGFVKVQNEKTILIPDWPGNNRLDTLENIVENKNVAVIFLIPGVNETLRINGEARLTTDESTLNLLSERDKHPKLVIAVEAKSVYLHCAKALMRSHLWSQDMMVDRSVLPTMGQMINDQTEASTAFETQVEMEARYEEELY